MRAVLRQMGNSTGVILPKPILAQIGAKLGDSLELTLEDGRVVLTRMPSSPRAGWAEAAAHLAAVGDDSLVWPEFGNDGDAELVW